MKPKKQNKIVAWLQAEQDRLQERYKERVVPILKKGYEYSGVWIVVRCICGQDFRTPYNMPDNGKCPKCKKLFCRGRR